MQHIRIHQYAANCEYEQIPLPFKILQDIREKQDAVVTDV
jgi:hypothetical protein